MNYKEQNILLSKLKAVNGLRGFDTKIKIRKNIALLESSLKPVFDESNSIKAITKNYDSEVEKIYQKYSKGKTKNEVIDGVPITRYDVKDSDQDVVFEEINKLSEKYKYEISEFTEKSIKFNKWYKENSANIDLIKISKSKLEEEDKDISEKNLDLLFDIIDFEK